MKEYEEEENKKKKKAEIPPQTLSVSQNIDLDELKEKFPNIYSELQDKEMVIPIDEVKEDLITSTLKEKGQLDRDPLGNYDPDVYDFLGRAKTVQEGQEIIEYMKKRGEITETTATTLLEKLRQEGIRSFGPQRTNGYYFKKAEEIRNKTTIIKRYHSSKED